jgi:hemerythrin-like domain-containing protein
MFTTDGPITDTRDMYSIHEAFRRALRDAPSQISSMDDGDTERSSRFAAYLSEVLWLLNAHHDGEDELLYPLLFERVPDQSDLFAQMEAEHGNIHALFQATDEATDAFSLSGSFTDGQALAAACGVLSRALDPHLTEEEVQVLPIVALNVTAEEWGMLPGHVLGSYAGERIWLPFGLAFEAMPEDLRQQMFTELPPPVLEMWLGGGSKAYESEMTAIRA